MSKNTPPPENVGVKGFLKNFAPFVQSYLTCLLEKWYNILTDCWKGVVSILDLEKVDYQDYTLVRNLILLRSEITYRANNQQTTDFLNYSLKEYDHTLKEFVDIVYARLDQIIFHCGFKDENLEMLNLLYDGYSFVEVGRIMKVGSKAIFNRLKRMILKINKVAEKRNAYENHID